MLAQLTVRQSNTQLKTEIESLNSMSAFQTSAILNNMTFTHEFKCFHIKNFSQFNFKQNDIYHFKS